MRWNVEVKSKPYHGQQRVIKKFALLPVMTEDGEVRWLERVNIKQIYRINPFGNWVNVCFV